MSSATASVPDLVSLLAQQKSAFARAGSVSADTRRQRLQFDKFLSATQTRGSTLLGIGAYMDYPSIFNGVDLNTKVVWTQNVDGSAYQGLGRDEKRLTVGGDFKYLGNFQVGITYVAYLSSPDIAQGRLMADRDYLSLNAKYAF